MSIVIPINRINRHSPLRDSLRKEGIRSQSPTPRAPWSLSPTRPGSTNADSTSSPPHTHTRSTSASETSSAAAALLGDVSGPFGSLPKLELVLQASAAAGGGGGGCFLVSDHATAADFPCWEMLDQLLALAAFFNLPPPLAALPHLAAFHAKFGALPANARYLASPLHTKLPCNNKSAVRSRDTLIFPL